MSHPVRTRANEHQRLAALRRAELLDTPPEVVFDRLAQLASDLLRAPVAVVSLVDAEREFFKSSVGLPPEWRERRETPRSQSLAEIALMLETPLAIEDARDHPLVKDNPIVPQWGVVSYAAVPIKTLDGLALGSVYVADRVPRVWTEGEITALSTIAKAAESEIVLRLALKDAEQSRVAMRAMLERVPYALFTLDREWNITFANEKAESVLGSTNAERIDNSLWSVCPHVPGTELELQLRLAMSAPGGSSFEGSLAQTGSWY